MASSCVDMGGCGRRLPEKSRSIENNCGPPSGQFAGGSGGDENGDYVARAKMSCELEIFLSFLAAILPSSLRIVCQYVLELHRNKDKLLSQQKKQKKEKKL